MCAWDIYQQQLWREKYLAVFDGLLSVFQTISSLAVVGCEIHDDFFDFPQMNAFVRYTLAWLSLTGTRISVQFNYYLLMKTYEFQVTVIDLVVMHQRQLFFQTLCIPLSLTCFFSFYILPSDYNQSFFLLFVE